MAGSSAVSCAGSWLDNAANGSGGAVAVQGGSALSWDYASTFVNNTAANYGGAVYVSDGSNLSWNAPTDFSSNMAGWAGGAVAVVANSSASLSGVTTYTRNTAELGGGLIVTGRSVARSSASTTFVENEAESSGGGAFVDENSSFLWSGGATNLFHGNQAQSGVAVTATAASEVFCTRDTTSMFSANVVSISGGALQAVFGSSVVFGGNTSFDSNRAASDPEIYSSGLGGAFSVLYGATSLGAEKPRSLSTTLLKGRRRDIRLRRDGALERGYDTL